MYELNTQRIRTGGHYCTECKKCTNPPRIRKHITPEYWHICEECGVDVLRVIFRPREEALLTDFKVKYQDIPALIKELQRIVIQSKTESQS